MRVCLFSFLTLTIVFFDSHLSVTLRGVTVLGIDAISVALQQSPNAQKPIYSV